MGTYPKQYFSKGDVDRDAPSVPLYLPSS